MVILGPPDPTQPKQGVHPQINPKYHSEYCIDRIRNKFVGYHTEAATYEVFSRML